jgi:hypothetical protein
MEGIEGGAAFPGTVTDRPVREGGIEDGFDSLERALADLAEAIEVHRKAASPVLKEEHAEDADKTLARLHEGGASETTTRLRRLIDRVNTMRRTVEETTGRLDF